MDRVLVVADPGGEVRVHLAPGHLAPDAGRQARVAARFDRLGDHAVEVGALVELPGVELEALVAVGDVDGSLQGRDDLVLDHVAGLVGAAPADVHPTDSDAIVHIAWDGNTAVGTYPITLTATEVVKKAGPHATTVYFVVNPCTEVPVPMVSQSVFDHQIEEGQAFGSDSVFVTNDALCGTLHFLASSDQAWVTAVPDTGSVVAGAIPGTMLKLEYNTASLTVGSYVAHVSVDALAKGAKVGSAMITINLTVNPKPPSIDSVMVQNVSVYAGNSVGVAVNFKNFEQIAGMSAGLHWSSADVTIDSVSFVGSRIAYISAKFGTVNNTNRTVKLGALRIPPEPLVLPGEGLWATLWFTAGQNCPVLVAIDSQFIAPGVELMFNDSLANSIYPQFAPGSIQVDCIPSFCMNGFILDNAQDAIVGATVELFNTFPPQGNPIATTTSGPVTVSMKSVRLRASRLHIQFACSSRAIMPITKRPDFLPAISTSV